MTAQQTQTKPLAAKCEARISCPNKPEYRVTYPFDTPDSILDICGVCIDTEDERGIQFYRRTARSIISVEAIS